MHTAFGFLNLYEGIFKKLAHALRLQRFLIAQVLPYSSNLLEMCFKETVSFLGNKASGNGNDIRVVVAVAKLPVRYKKTPLLLKSDFV